MSLSYDSPKRKRGSSDPSGSITPNNSQNQLQLQIPLTPPNSSPPQDAKTEDTMRHTTNLNGVQVVLNGEDAGSPRTRVAYHFQGLQLDDGGDVSKLSLEFQRSKPPKLSAKLYDGAIDDEETAVRKRMRVFDQLPNLRFESKSQDIEVPETPMANAKQFGISIGPERSIDPMIEEKAKNVILHNEFDPVIFKGSAAHHAKGVGLARAYPSINRLADSKSRAKSKRAGTPPLFGAADASIELAGGVVDQERAALTWHDDEITGHNPTDPDDDGEGINGIGFRPTAAEAYTRSQKRRQQMMEYKTREAKEARARRSEKRRGAEAIIREEKEAARRVRFMDIDKSSVIST